MGVYGVMLDIGLVCKCQLSSPPAHTVHNLGSHKDVVLSPQEFVIFKEIRESYS